MIAKTLTGISLGMRPANERLCNNVTKSLIGWVHILIPALRNSLLPFSNNLVSGFDDENLPHINLYNKE